MISDTEGSVVYRTGGFSTEDYDEAIQMLQDAKTQLYPGDYRTCMCCGDSGHQAFTCHHNPLVRAREGVKKEYRWRCYHCDWVFDDFAEAEEHFGRRGDDGPKCLQEEQSK